jgi:hypothetical protein
MAEIQLADVVVEMADTLVDEFDVIDFLHVWTERCVDLPGVSAAGVAVDRRAGRVAGGGRLLRTDPAAELFQLQTDQRPGCGPLSHRSPRVGRRTETATYFPASPWQHG